MYGRRRAGGHALFVLAPHAVARLFGTPTNIPNPDDYWLFAEKTFRIFLSLTTFTCIVKVSSIFFQAAGKPVRAVVASMVRDILCFIPLILILPRFFGIEGILYAAPGRRPAGDARVRRADDRLFPAVGKGRSRGGSRVGPQKSGKFPVRRFEVGREFLRRGERQEVMPRP